MALEILHKKSAVSQKQPLPSDLGLGELALNYHADGPFLTCKDTDGNVRKLNHVWVGVSAPTSPSVGDPWLDTSVKPARLLIYKDAVDQWVAVLNINSATTTTAGIVRLASATDVTNGTPGRIVDAAQLQAASSGYVSSISVSSPLLLGGTSQKPSISLAAQLNDLQDVAVTGLAGGQVLISDATGQWVNTYVLSCGTY